MWKAACHRSKRPRADSVSVVCGTGVFFWELTFSTSSRNVCPPSWILKAEEGWGEEEISTKGVVVRQTSL